VKKSIESAIGADGIIAYASIYVIKGSI